MQHDNSRHANAPEGKAQHGNSPHASAPGGCGHDRTAHGAAGPGVPNQGDPGDQAAGQLTREYINNKGFSPGQNGFRNGARGSGHPSPAETTVRIPAGLLVARYAAEHRRLASLTQELEQILGASPGLAGAMNSQERRALQRLDYLRQALGDLACSIERFAPQGEIDPARLTNGLALEDIARRLRHGEAPVARPSGDGMADFFD